jgi:hypothetical protein
MAADPVVAAVRLEITVGELLPAVPVALLKQRRELLWDAAIKLWGTSARRAWPSLVPRGELCRPEAFPADLWPHPQLSGPEPLLELL